MKVYPDATATTNATSATIYFDHVLGEVGIGEPPQEPIGPLCRLQEWLQGGREATTCWPMAWIGNRVSDLRYWLWRLCR